MRKYTKFLLVGSISIVFSACNDNAPIHEYQPVPNSVGNVISLEQNWTEEMREAFYFTSQGSHIMPYEWFLYLEQATNDNLFRANDNVTSFRYTPSKRVLIYYDVNPIFNIIFCFLNGQKFTFKGINIKKYSLLLLFLG